MAVSHWHDQGEICNGELPGIFAEFCIRGPWEAIRAQPMRPQGGPLGPGPPGPRGAHKGPAHKGPGEPTRARPTRAQGGPQGPRGLPDG